VAFGILDLRKQCGRRRKINSPAIWVSVTGYLKKRWESTKPEPRTVVRLRRKPISREKSPCSRISSSKLVMKSSSIRNSTANSSTSNTTGLRSNDIHVPTVSTRFRSQRILGRNQCCVVPRFLQVWVHRKAACRVQWLVGGECFCAEGPISVMPLMKGNHGTTLGVGTD